MQRVVTFLGVQAVRIWMRWHLEEIRAITVRARTPCAVFCELSRAGKLNMEDVVGGGSVEEAPLLIELELGGIEEERCVSWAGSRCAHLEE